MKFIRVQIQDNLYTKLKTMSDHHGHYSDHVRKAIRAYVTQHELTTNPGGTTCHRP